MGEASDFSPAAEANESFVVFDFAVVERVLFGVDTSGTGNPVDVFSFASGGDDLGNIADEREVRDKSGGLLDENVGGGGVGHAEGGDASVNDGGGFAEVGSGVDDFLAIGGLALESVGVDGFDFGDKLVVGETDGRGIFDAVRVAIGVADGASGCVGDGARAEALNEAGFGNSGSAGENVSEGGRKETAEAFGKGAEARAGGDRNEAISDGAKESVFRGKVEGTTVLAVESGRFGKDDFFSAVVSEDGAFRGGGATAGLEVTTKIFVGAGS